MYIVSDGQSVRIYRTLTEAEILHLMSIHSVTILRVDTYNATDVIRIYEVDESGDETQLKETPQ